jgi:integrase
LQPPSYRLHKPTGQAVVSFNRKDHYLGKYGTPESRLRYERLITQWMQTGTAPTAAPDASNDLTVAELCAEYLRFASGYYVKANAPTSQLGNVKRAIKTMRETYPDLPAKDFSPLKLKTVRQQFVAEGLARVNCNRHAGIIKRIFSWGVENELIPSAVARDGQIHAIVDSLRNVRALEKGRCEAHETDPVLPVDEDIIQATLDHLRPQMKAMVKIQLLLACRPGELLQMRQGEIDRSGPVWLFRPSSHKTEHRGKTRVIPIGPRAQLLLKPWLTDDPDALVFPSMTGGPLTTTCCTKAIFRACDKAGVERWSAGRLRHNAATRIRAHASLDAAQVILGHSSVQTTQIYAEKNLAAAMKIAAEVG